MRSRRQNLDALTRLPQAGIKGNTRRRARPSADRNIHWLPLSTACQFEAARLPVLCPLQPVSGAKGPRKPTLADSAFKPVPGRFFLRLPWVYAYMPIGCSVRQAELLEG